MPDSFSGYPFKAAQLGVDVGHKENSWKEHCAAACFLLGLAHQDRSSQRWSQRGRSFGEKACVYAWLIFTTPVFWQRGDWRWDNWKGFVCKLTANEDDWVLVWAPRSWAGAQGLLGQTPTPHALGTAQVEDAALACWKNKIPFPFCFAAAD